MNKNLLIGLGVSCAAYIGLGACAPAPTATPSSRPTPKAAVVIDTPYQIKSLKLLEIANIFNPNPPGKSINVAMITITDINVKKLKHNSDLYKSDQSGIIYSGSPTEKIPEYKLNGKYDTRLDFNATEYVKNDGIMLVEIVLQDSDIEFYPGNLAITGGDTDSLAMMCVLKPIDAKPSDRMLSFYIVKAPTGNTKLLSFGVALVIDEQGSSKKYRLPVVIDPGVKNDG